MEWIKFDKKEELPKSNLLICLDGKITFYTEDNGIFVPECEHAEYQEFYDYEYKEKYWMNLPELPNI